MEEAPPALRCGVETRVYITTPPQIIRLGMNNSTDYVLFMLSLIGKLTLYDAITII